MAFFPRIYNPSNEPTDEEQAVAARWELLRRNTTFQSVARQWIESREFRLAHANTPQYHDQKTHYPRCALDWMLTGSERAEVFHAQLAKNRVFVDSRFNFGPIICRPRVSSLEVMKCRGRDCFRIEPRQSNVLLRLDDTWRDAPQPFKTQFKLAITGDAEFAEVQQQFQEVGNFLRWASHRLNSEQTPEKLKEIAAQLFDIGANCSGMAEFHRLFALPNASYTPTRLNQYFDRIRASFEASGQFDRRARYDRTKSFLGTPEDWKWYLLAEDQQLDWRKSKDLYRLAQIYTDELKPRPGKPNRANVKGYGGINQPARSKLVTNRRRTVFNHCDAIQRWIEKQYPPEC